MGKYFNKGLAFLSALFLSLFIPVIPSHASGCVEQPVLTFDPAVVSDNGGLVKIKGSGFCMTDNDFGVMVSVGFKDVKQFNQEGGYNGFSTENEMVPKAKISDGAFEISLRIPRYDVAKLRVLRTASWSRSGSDFSQERPAGERYALKKDIPYESVSRVDPNGNGGENGSETPVPNTCNPNPKLELDPDPISYEGGIITIKGSGFCEPEKFGTKQGVLITVGPNNLDGYDSASSSEIGQKLIIRLSTEEKKDNYTPNGGGNAVLAADGSFTVRMQVPAQDADEKYAVFTSGGGYYAASEDSLDQKLTINFMEKPPVPVKQPSLEVSKAKRNGGSIHIVGKNYLAKYPGVYICILPSTFDNLHTNADNCYEGKVIWITPNEETNIDANTVHMNENGSFELDLKVPAFVQGKEWIVTTARAHGLAREDKSQSVNVPVIYEEAKETPKEPGSGNDSSSGGTQPTDIKITLFHKDVVASTLYAGDNVDIVINNLKPKQLVKIYLHSKLKFIGEYTANEAGEVRVPSVVLPEAGKHTFKVLDANNKEILAWGVEVFPKESINSLGKGVLAWNNEVMSKGSSNPVSNGRQAHNVESKTDKLPDSGVDVSLFVLALAMLAVGAGMGVIARRNH